MVLQTAAEGGKPGGLFGTASPGETILLVGEHEFTGAPFPGSPYQITADSRGAWTINWDGGNEDTSEGPYQLRLSALDHSGALVNSIVAQDVWLGDVYLCSGQSNMERDVSYIDNSTAELANADQPRIRLFQNDKTPRNSDLLIPYNRSERARYTSADARFGYFGAPVEPTRDTAGSCLYWDSSAFANDPGNPCESPVRARTAHAATCCIY